MSTTLALEGSGATIQFLGCGFSSDLLGLVLSDKAREAIETTHLGTAVAKTYRPGETQDLGTIEAVFDHAPEAVNLVGRPPEQIVIRYPDTELMQYDPIVLWGFAVQQGGEKMWPDNRMVTGVTIKLSVNTDEVIHGPAIVPSQIYAQTWYLYVDIEWCVLSGMGLSGDVPAAVLTAFAAYGGQVYAAFESGVSGVSQGAIISFGPQPQLLTGDLTIYGATVDSCTPASNPLASLTIPVSSVSVPATGVAIATSTGATYTPVVAASLVSGWLIDPLFNYVARPTDPTRRVTTFTSQTIP